VKQIYEYVSIAEKIFSLFGMHSEDYFSFLGGRDSERECERVREWE
jgi:flavodoxin